MCIHNHTVALLRLGPLIGGGGICVMSLLLVLGNGLVSGLPYGGLAGGFRWVVLTEFHLLLTVFLNGVLTLM